MQPSRAQVPAMSGHQKPAACARAHSRAQRNMGRARAQALGLNAIKLTAPSVLVTGNSALADVSALARLAGCASGNPTGTTGIVLEVHPAGQALKCTLVAWKQVCDYIAADNQARNPGPPGDGKRRCVPPAEVLAC